MSGRKIPILMRGTSERWWVFRWRVFRVVIGLPTYLAVALRDGASAFGRDFRDAWSERPRHGNAKAAYEEIVEGRYR